MSDSEEDWLPDVPKAPRVKRFRFKTFAERVAEVEVDVYRSLVQTKAEPSGGSWLSDGLAHWRELNSASHFLQAAAEVQNLCQSLPLLLLHRGTVEAILLGALEPAARLSLPALLDLVAAFARDLQAEFLPILPRLVRRLVALLDGGAEREPETIESIFTCVSLVFKHLVRLLAADLPAALRATAPLRHHSSDHVRQFAAQAAGFLLRSAPSTPALRAGVRAALAEQAARPSPERTDATGLLLAEAVLGVKHGLHSRAPAVLGLLLREDLIAPEELTPAAAAAAAAAAARQQPAAAGAEAAEAEAGQPPAAAVAVVAAQPPSREQLRARAAAVARVTLDRLLDHLRRGRGGELWSALLGETTSRLRSFESSAAGSGSGSGVLSAEAAAAGRSLGRILLLLAQSVSYFRGSRVDDYAPLFDLMARLMQPAVWIPTAGRTAGTAGSQQPGVASPGSVAEAGHPSPGSSSDGGHSHHQNGEESPDGEAADLVHVSLSYAVLDLARSIIHSHVRQAGASEGPAALSKCPAAWAPAFGRPPASEVLPFVKSLMVYPSNADIARIFGAPMMGCLGRILMVPPPSTSAGSVAGVTAAAAAAGAGACGQADYAGAALLLLRDLCALIQPPESGSGSARSALPLLMTAQPGGVRLAAHVRQLAAAWRAAADAEDARAYDEAKGIAGAWAAVGLLPYACENVPQAIEACESVLAAATEALRQVPTAAAAPPPPRLGGLLLLRAEATEQLAELLKSQPAAAAAVPAAAGLSRSLVDAAEASLQWVLDQQAAAAAAAAAGGSGGASVSGGADYASIRAAGSLLKAVRAGLTAAASGGAAAESARALLSVARLSEVVAVLAPLLSAESQALRAAVLRLLCCFDQPHLEALGPDPRDPIAALHQPPPPTAAASGKGGKAGKGGAKSDQAAAAAAAAALVPAGAAGPKCDLIEVLYGINAKPPTIESGRKWSVAMGRLKTYMEYGRIPSCLVPAFAHGMLGVLCVRFSPLWAPASEALAHGLQFRAQETWPIVFAFLSACQCQLLTGDFPAAAAANSGGREDRGGRHPSRHRSASAASAAITAAPVVHEIPPEQDASVIESLYDRYDKAASAGAPRTVGGLTDPQNRLSHVLRAMAGAPYAVIEARSRDWAPLFLEYTAARGSHFDDGEGDVEAAVAAARAAAEAATVAAAAKPEERAKADGGDEEEAGRPRKKAKKGGKVDAAAAVAAAAAAPAAAAAEDVAMADRRASNAGASSSAAAATPGKKGKKAAAAAPSTPAPAQAQAPPSEPPAAKPTAIPGSGSGSGSASVSVLSRIGGRTWRAGLLDWLKLLGGLRGVRGLARAEELQRAVATHLLEPEGPVQMAALRCLRPYRFRWLPAEMSDRLNKLADDATLREEMAVFPLAPGADGGVGEEARPGLVPLLIRVLFPKMRKRSGRLGGRGAPGSARAAILNFLAHLRPPELRPLLELLLEPMAAAFQRPPPEVEASLVEPGRGAAAEASAASLDSFRLLPPPWWSAPLLGRGLAWWLAAVDGRALAALPPRRKVGFLNAFEDLLSHLGHAVEPFLPPLLAIALRLLASATEGIGAVGTAAVGTAAAVGTINGLGEVEAVPEEAEEANGKEADDDEEEEEEGGKAAVGGSPWDRSREVRTGSLRLLAQVWLRFPASPSADFNAGWGVFLGAVEPLLPRMALEAAASKEPPLLECVLSLSLSPGLARLLGDLPTVPDATLPLLRPAGAAAAAAAATAAAARAAAAAAMAAGGAPPPPPALAMGADAMELDGASEGDEGGKEAWRQRGLGSALMRATVAMLGSGRCTEIVRATVLDVLDALLGCGEALLRRVLLPGLGPLLTALNSAIAEAWAAPGPGGRGRAAGRRRAAGSSAHRELAVLERLGAYVGDPGLAASLAEGLVALLSQAGARSAKQRAGAKGGRLDESGVSRALCALAALWGRLAPGDLPDAAVERYCEAMSLWAIRLTTREPRAALAAAYASVARLIPRMRPTAQLLADLTAWNPTSLDDVDYDRRLAAYGRLTSGSYELVTVTAESDAAAPESGSGSPSGGAWAGMGRLQALPLLLAALHDLRSGSDLSLRQASAAALEALVVALGEAEARLAESGSVSVSGPESGDAADGGSDGLLRLAGRVLYPQLKSQLGSPTLAVRQEHLALLRALVVALPKRFPDLLPLLSDDPETDFFANVAHLQSHRRTRALNKLSKVLRDQAAAAAAGAGGAAIVPAATAAAGEADAGTAGGPCGGRALIDVVVPLLQQFVEEAAGLGGPDQGRAHDKKQSDKDKEANVTDAAVGALGAVAGVLRWPQYEQLLNQFVRLMRKRPAKPLVRSVCAIIDSFHFPLPTEDDEFAPAPPAAAAPVAAAVAPAPAAAAGVKRSRGEAAAEGAAAAAPAAPADATDAAAGTAAAAEPAANAEPEAEDAEAEEAEAEALDLEDPSLAPAPAYVHDPAAEAAEVQRVLLKRILPALHEMLVETKRGEGGEADQAVRAPVALALVKLLRLLPPAAERAELPRALQGVTNLLKARLQRIRDDARTVLVSMMAELGPSYMPYCCHVLRASLPDRGFTAHVIGYTLHAVLEAVLKVAAGESAAAAAAAAMAEPAEDPAAAKEGYDEEDEEPPAGPQEDPAGPVGVLDDCLEMCLPLVEADLFGHVAEAKEVGAFAGQYKEAKRCRAYEAYQLLAQGVTLRTHARMLLSSVTDRLHQAGQPSVRAKLVRLLQFAARGLRTNPTAGPKQVMELVVGVMEGCLTREEAARAAAKAAVGPARSAVAAGLSPGAAAAARAAAAAAGDGAAGRATLHETLVLEFCLTLLLASVRRGVLAGRSPELLALLDPALPLLVRSLRSRHAGCVTLALKTLSAVVPLPLPGLASAAPEAGKAVGALLRKVPNVQHPIAQECFRLLAALLRDCPAYRPTTAMLRFLLGWAFEDLGEAGAAPTAFALLRALLGRRVVVPEVYDVMDRVQQIMVRSQSSAVRSSCSAALLQFLLDFPLGPARLQQHLGFLLANLEYEYESGRLQVLDMLGQVVAKFPAEVLQAQSDVLLMPLVVRLVNDPAPKARASAAQVLRSLLGRLEPAPLDRAAAYCRGWMGREGGGGAAALRRAAAQALGLMAEVEGARFTRRLAEVAPALRRILERQASLSEDQDPTAAAADGESPAADDACPGWQEAYYSLILLEKVAAGSGSGSGSALAWPGPGSGSASEAAAGAPYAPAIWEAVVRLLLHRHVWVRKAAARLVGYGLAAPRVSGGLLGGAPAAAPGGAEGGANGAGPCGGERAGQLAYSFLLQLECEEADDATCLQAVKCLVSLVRHLPAGGAPAEAQAGAGAEQQGRDGKRSRGPAPAANGSAAAGRGGDDEDEEVDEGEEGENEEEEEEEEGGATANGHAGAEEEGAADGEGGDGDGDGDDDAGEGGPSMADQVATRCLTLRGLVRRMARLADDARWSRTRQRAAALRWIAAASSALGAAAVAPYLPVLLRPLYRISEAAAAPPAAAGAVVEDDVRQLAEEVMSHLRTLVGAETLLASYNAAREHVKGRRTDRRKKSAVRGMLDPAAAAAARLRHGARKAEGRKRKMEMMKRERGSGGGRGGRGRGGRGGFKRPRT
ncbi:hypothetical protein HYH03_013624 [Edaphochlamys debaryana]|uniref:Uncharacterized protein n=1 Tax=Edaphochlamys debaryana TaxID=47281 RepID=A0A836BSZ7_9CHLO|nr:hypothetical protein HYH03_013624 [Edaphochlamys debaryana]|eukprot:KAG2487780.1 hypothetical protein HYH03_013624 [Edaphochlamys debaryana]